MEQKDLQAIKNELKLEKCNTKLPLDELELDEDILYRKTYSPYGEPIRAIILTPDYTQKALRLAHSVFPAGHGGVKVTLNRCMKMAYWPGIKKDVKKYCKQCQVCSHFKSVGNSPQHL